MCNALFGFRLGRESIADRGLTRCLLKMQQRITDSSVVRGQLSVEPGYRPVSVVSGQVSVVGRTETGGAAHHCGSDGERPTSHGSASVTGDRAGARGLRTGVPSEPRTEPCVVTGLSRGPHSGGDLTGPSGLNLNGATSRLASKGRDRWLRKVYGQTPR